MCLNSPTLPCFIAFCSTHSYTSEIFATCNYYNQLARLIHSIYLAVYTNHFVPTVTLYIPETPSLLVRNGDVELTVAVQMYSPESLVSTELIVAVLV